MLSTWEAPSKHSFTVEKTEHASLAWTRPFRQNLTEGLSDGLDDQILSGTTAGLFTGTNLANNNIRPSTTLSTATSTTCAGIRLTVAMRRCLKTWPWWSARQRSKTWEQTYRNDKC